MKQFLLYLDESNALGKKFIIQDIDDTHIFVIAELVNVLQERLHIKPHLALKKLNKTFDIMPSDLTSILESFDLLTILTDRKRILLKN
eukprot:bmy_20141T0